MRPVALGPTSRCKRLRKGGILKTTASERVSGRVRDRGSRDPADSALCQPSCRLCRYTLLSQSAVSQASRLLVFAVLSPLTIASQRGSCLPFRVACLPTVTRGEKQLQNFSFAELKTPASSFPFWVISVLLLIRKRRAVLSLRNPDSARKHKKSPSPCTRARTRRVPATCQ